MKKVFMIIAAMCMTSIMASAQKTIRVSTDKTDLVMQVSPKGRLYQVYLGDKLKNPSDYNHLKWDVYAASDGSVCQRRQCFYADSFCLVQVPQRTHHRIMLHRGYTDNGLSG